MFLIGKLNGLTVLGKDLLASVSVWGHRRLADLRNRLSPLNVDFRVTNAGDLSRAERLDTFLVRGVTNHWNGLILHT